MPINAIPLLEAQVSSEIENIATSTDQMVLFAGTDPLVRMAVGHDQSKPSTRSLTAMGEPTACSTSCTSWNKAC